MELPRRIQLEKMTSAERAIYNAALLVEEMGADVKLTEAVTKLSEARSLVADFVDQSIEQFSESFSHSIAESKKANN
jgi:hypothetical protein